MRSEVRPERNHLGPLLPARQDIILGSEVKNDAWAGRIPVEGYGSRETSRTKLVADYVRFYERNSAGP